MPTKATRFKTVSVLSAAFAIFTSAPANADYIEGVPTNWRLQDYGNSNSYNGVTVGVNLFFTGSPCNSGQLTLPQTSADWTNRLWATVLTARATNKVVGIYYHLNSGQCVIDSFYLKEGG